MTPPDAIRLDWSADRGRADLRIAVLPVNVLDVASLAALARQIGLAREARVLVLTGLPKAFCAGVDVADHVPEPAPIERMLAAMRDVLEALVRTPAITLAAVSGACLGGGAEIVAACDLALATDDARIGFPEIRLACFPPGAAALLPGRVGEARATEWILSGRILSGREAAAAGFVSRSVSETRLPEETDRLVERILETGREALSSARDLMRAGRREALEKRLPVAEDAYRRLAGNAELARAVREFRSGVIPSPSASLGTGSARDPFRVKP
ncbi:MAG: enoyl-CoA hydratase/isomerase family protein [Acidobacteriota bacterium]